MAPKKSFVRLREVVYTLSPFEQNIMDGLFQNVPYKVNKYWNLWGFDALVFGVIPYFATINAANYIVRQVCLFS
jgi:hypothetical protein